MDTKNTAVHWISTTRQNIFDARFFNPGFDAAKIHAILKLIPPDAKVSASALILPHLAERKYAYEFPAVGDAEYIAVFVAKDFYPAEEDVFTNQLLNYLNSPSWESIAYTPPFLLMKKNNHASQRIKIDSVVCGAEEIGPDRKHFIALNGELLDNADARDSLMKHSGSYSARLNNSNEYGFTYHATKFKPGDLLKITVWKYPAFLDTGKLVLSCGKHFRMDVSGGKNIDSLGWEQLQAYVIVPEDDTNLVIYTWNRTSANVWFDDLKIVRCSIR